MAEFVYVSTFVCLHAQEKFEPAHIVLKEEKSYTL